MFRWRRDQVTADIAHSFPDKSAGERAAICAILSQRGGRRDGVARSFGASAEAPKRRVAFENHEIIDRSGRGKAVGRAARAALLQLGVAPGAPVGRVPVSDRCGVPEASPEVARCVPEHRARALRGKPIPREDFIYELMNRAGTPRGYALIADQTPRREDKKHWTRMLDRDTAFFLGAEKIARFLDAPVLYVDMRRVRRGHYSVRFTPLAEPPHAIGNERRRLFAGDGGVRASISKTRFAQLPPIGFGSRSAGSTRSRRALSVTIAWRSMALFACPPSQRAVARSRPLPPRPPAPPRGAATRRRQVGRRAVDEPRRFRHSTSIRPDGATRPSPVALLIASLHVQ